MASNKETRKGRERERDYGKEFLGREGKIKWDG